MDQFTSLINSYLPEPHASLLNGIVLGIDLQTTYSFKDKLKDVGLIHIVVLSGMNITLLSAVILQIIIPLFGRKAATIITIVSIIFFIYFVGIDPPIVRAGIMGILSLIGLMFGRKTLALYTLFLTSIICIIIWPDWLTSISFQLSFAATFGIILFGNVVSEEKTTNTIKNYLIDELRVSLSAQLFTTPIIFFYFRQISFISPIANILVSWTIAPIMIYGIIAMVVGSIHWQLGFVVSWLCYGLVTFIILVVEWLSQIPFASVKIL
ncbi:MAG: competence protein ComEC [Patescibacteria group bacterium]|jgi:competence protein ComEC|nr:competence protein ComEC [Patescibacteria group bacterium]